jgi:cobalt transport protein ATP-binding subunit
MEVQMSARSAVEVENIFFSYPDGNEVLKGLSCNILNGEKIALIGPNGAGKSTFMKHLNGVELATKGRIVIDGMEVMKENLTKIRRKVGMVFQDPDDQLFCPTVFDDVAFGPLNLGLSKDEIHSRVETALELVGLSGFEARSSFHLSFGERKRLALATVLSYQPEILVFDEPSSNMDPVNRRKLIKWLQSSDKTIILCTHDLDFALDLCSRCLILTDGRIVANGPASEILYNRNLLEENNLELPLALITYELLHNKLQLSGMIEEHRMIIRKFLHAHHHAHGPDQHEHVHLHAHHYENEHLHDSDGKIDVHGHFHAHGPDRHKHVHVHAHNEGDEHPHKHEGDTGIHNHHHAHDQDQDEHVHPHVHNEGNEHAHMHEGKADTNAPESLSVHDEDADDNAHEHSGETEQTIKELLKPFKNGFSGG